MAKKRAPITIDKVFPKVDREYPPVGLDAAEERDWHAMEEARLSPPELAMRRLEDAAQALRRTREEIVEYLEEALHSLRGAVLDDAVTKDELLDKIRYLLRSSERRIKCPKCGEPALPFLIRNSEGGTIQLQHRGGAQGDACSLLGEDRKWPPLEIVVLSDGDDNED